MCRAAAAVLALGLSAGVPIARAQASAGADARPAALLARAESLQARITLGESLARREVYRQRIARRFDAGDLTVLLAASAGDATGRRVALGAASYLDSLGAIPGSWIAGHVVVAFEAAGVDSVLRAERIGGRAKVMAGFAPEPDSFADGFVAAAALTRDFWRTLDADWRGWAPADLGLGWSMARDGEAARQEMLKADTRAGEHCLEGAVAGCRLWLGLDRDPDSFQRRYQSDELRRMIQFMPRYEGSRALADQCLRGLDAACVEFARQSQTISPIPAGLSSQRSFIHAVRALHGSAALRRALADTLGSVGARFARASGVSEDSLLTEWRIWLLTGGGHPRVTAEVGDALPVVIMGALLLFAAARSGRWR